MITYACPFCRRPFKENDNKSNHKNDHEQNTRIHSLEISNSQDINILGLTQRTYNILKRSGIDNVDELIGKTDSDLLKLKGFGQRSLIELHQKLQIVG